jgi:glycosyltransferase involved in cell wall biosynthesis
MREELQQAFEHAAGGVRSIAVLLPCHNEEATVAQVIEDFCRALPSADIYVYDNNSTDRTAEVAKAAAAIVRFEPYQGKGNVVRRMFADIDADIYVLADGDPTTRVRPAGSLRRWSSAMPTWWWAYASALRRPPIVPATGPATASSTSWSRACSATASPISCRATA